MGYVCQTVSNVYFIFILPSHLFICFTTPITNGKLFVKQHSFLIQNAAETRGEYLLDKLIKAAYGIR